jgi:outer membrane protein, multidrug efflux system
LGGSIEIPIGPNLKAASLHVASTFFATQQAVQARLPRIALTESFGTVNSDVLALNPDFSNPVGSLGANLLPPLFYGGQLKAQVDIKTAGQKAAVAAYGGAVLGALREVENALGAEVILRQREAVLLEMVQEDARAVAVSQKRYDVGKEDLLPGLHLRQRLFAAQTSLIHVRAQRIIERINLHLALGGGFVPPVDSPSATR